MLECSAASARVLAFSDLRPTFSLGAQKARDALASLAVARSPLRVVQRPSPNLPATRAALLNAFDVIRASPLPPPLFARLKARASGGSPIVSMRALSSAGLAGRREAVLL